MLLDHSEVHTVLIVILVILLSGAFAVEDVIIKFPAMGDTCKCARSYGKNDLRVSTNVELWSQQRMTEGRNCKKSHAVVTSPLK